jgi:hypothetical protein
MVEPFCLSESSSNDVEERSTRVTVSKVSTCSGMRFDVIDGVHSGASYKIMILLAAESPSGPVWCHSRR